MIINFPSLLSIHCVVSPTKNEEKGNLSDETKNSPLMKMDRVIYKNYEFTKIFTH